MTRRYRSPEIERERRIVIAVVAICMLGSSGILLALGEVVGALAIVGLYMFGVLCLAGAARWMSNGGQQ